MHLYMPSPCKVHGLVQLKLTGDWGQRLILGWEAGWTQIKYLEMISLREKQGTNPTDQFQPTTIISTINYTISILQKKKSWSHPYFKKSLLYVSYPCTLDYVHNKMRRRHIQNCNRKFIKKQFICPSTLTHPAKFIKMIVKKKTHCKDQHQKWGRVNQKWGIDPFATSLATLLLAVFIIYW